jgi:hypothetical protein
MRRRDQTHVVIGCGLHAAGFSAGTHHHEQVLASNGHMWVCEMAPKRLQHRKHSVLVVVTSCWLHHVHTKHACHVSHVVKHRGRAEVCDISPSGNPQCQPCASQTHCRCSRAPSWSGQPVNICSCWLQMMQMIAASACTIRHQATRCTAHAQLLHFSIYRDGFLMSQGRAPRIWRRA